MTKLYVGIDVCKDFLDVYIYPEGKFKQFNNTKQGHRQINKWLNNYQIEQVSRGLRPKMPSFTLKKFCVLVIG